MSFSHLELTNLFVLGQITEAEKEDDIIWIKDKFPL
jgi:hypothetical protein